MWDVNCVVNTREEHETILAKDSMNHLKQTSVTSAGGTYNPALVWVTLFVHSGASVQSSHLHEGSLPLVKERTICILV